jgi:hypothetical protein
MTDIPRDEQNTPLEQREAAPTPTPTPTTRAADAPSERVDPNDEVPVPIAMSPAEVDERAQVVEALREEEGIAAPPDQADGQG